MDAQQMPQVMQALMMRRAAGLAGGTAPPAVQQTMSPNPFGGPLGPSQTPLATSPQAVPVAGILPSNQSSPAGPLAARMAAAGGQQGGQPTTSSTSHPANKMLMKALFTRLVADL